MTCFYLQLQTVVSSDRANDPEVDKAVLVMMQDEPEPLGMRRQAS